MLNILKNSYCSFDWNNINSRRRHGCLWKEYIWIHWLQVL